MPAPMGTALSQTAKLNFAGQGVQLPVFHEPTLNRYHTGAARNVGQAMAMQP